ncbi:cytochrome-c peroxidase [Gaopeijia maritima]|uniref:cytochrome-c peroxidase n=1 Tax=Gaopeijia maritima TaxID=3119007 RepID=UPI0032430B02
MHRSIRVAVTAALAAGVGLLGCSGSTDPGDEPADDLRARVLAAGLTPLPEAPIYPVENPYVESRAELGRLLFFDPILSGPMDVACSTCHLPRLGFGDGRQFAAGAGATGLGPERTEPGPWPLRPMPRNSPTVFNIGHYGRGNATPTSNGTMFWSGSAFGLEDQVLNPIAADNELRGTTYAKPVAVDSVLLRLRAVPGYLDRFRTAFPEVVAASGEAPENVVTHATLRLALAAYLRELRTPRAPFDLWLAGDDRALSDRQKAGLELFVGDAGCAACHTGPLLSDFSMHVIGARQEGLGRDTTRGDDLGWGEHGGTPYSFRTPPLRQVGATAPYFHAGTAATLLDVVRFKNAGVSAHASVAADRLSPRVRPLGLTDSELDDLVAFLMALTDSVTVLEPLFQAPASVPSGLEVPR